ncbi:MAG: Ig-like domain-containing protein [Candidatus Thorarchaeota archaeon]
MKRMALLVFVTVLALIVLNQGILEVSADDELAVCRNEEITITATLLQNLTYGNPVPNQELEFFDQTADQFIGSSLTDSNGVASVDWMIPPSHLLGPTLINVTFRGNTSLALSSSCQYVLLTVMSRTKIQVTIENDILAPDDTLSIEVLILNDVDEPIIGAPILLLNDSDFITTENTNYAGYAKFNIECNSSWFDLGLNTLQVVYESDFTEFNQIVTETIDITMNQIITHLTPQEVFPDQWTLDETISLSLNFWTDSSNPFETPLEVLLDNQLLLTAFTNESGIADILLKIDERYTIGSHVLRITYTGTERYTQSEIEREIVIVSPVHMDVVFHQPLEIGCQAQATFNLWDIFHRSIPNASVEIRDTSTGMEVIKPVSFIQTELTFDIQGTKGPRIFHFRIMGTQFITNGTLNLETIVWSRPAIDILQNTILGYASPEQLIEMEILLHSPNETYSDCRINLLSHNESVISSTMTNSQGIATISWTAPVQEGQYTISVFYTGNTIEYILDSSVIYNYTVCRLIPILVNLDYYTIITPLQEITVQFILRALNGTFLSGMQTDYEWLNIHGTVYSLVEGIITLHLIVPPTAGNHSLHYTVQGTLTTQSTTGIIQITVEVADVLAAQGVGIPGILTSLVVSSGVAVIPIIRRWYLIG